VTVLDQERLRRLIEVGRGLVAELDLDAVLEQVLDVACELTGARYAALGVLNDDRRELARFITRGIDDPTRRSIGDLPRGHGVLGTLIRDPRPLRLADVKRHADSWGFPAGHPQMTTFLGVPILIRGEAWGNLYLTDKPGGEQFDDQDEETMVVLADWAAIAVANAQAHSIVRGRRDELERAVTGLEATMEIARAVGAETQLDRVLELIVKRGRALVKARAMTVLVQEGDEVVVTALAGQIDASIMGMRLPLAESISGQVLRTGRAERLSDPRSRLRSGLATAVGANAGLYVPMLYRGRALGVLNAFDRLEGGPDFAAEDQRLMESFAASAAVAIATAQNAAAQGLRRSIEAAERERAHWARELHDQTLQDLAALSMRLSSARRQDDMDAVHGVIDQAMVDVRAAAVALRDVISELRPASLDELGLRPALEALVDRMRDVHSLDVRLVYEAGEGDPRLAPEIENAAYRLVQEALTNVAKHAQAQTARVTVTESGHAVAVSVSDDGRGFSATAGTEGFGLLGMRERVTLVGGTLEIDSREGSGTTVWAGLPLARAARERGALKGGSSAAQPAAGPRRHGAQTA
jgi:signal transduction histidine kinase